MPRCPRSRAFIASFDECFGAEHSYLESFARNRCSEWIIANTDCGGVQAYLRLPSPIAISTMQSMHERMHVVTTTISFKRQNEEYTIRGFQICSMTKAKLPAKSATLAEARVMTVVNTNGACGTIAWVNYEKMNETYRSLMHKLNSRDDVFIPIDSSPTAVRRLVFDEIITRKRVANAIVLITNESADKYNDGFLTYLDELRSGYLLGRDQFTRGRNYHTDYRPP